MYSVTFRAAVPEFECRAQNSRCGLVSLAEIEYENRDALIENRDALIENRDVVMANRDHCCLLGTPLQNEYNEHVKNDEHDNVEIEYNERVKNDDNNVQIEYNVHVKNDEHVNVEIEYNEHVKNYVHDNVEINDKQSMIQNPRSIDSIVQRPRSFEQRTSFSLFPIMHDSYDNQ